MSDVRIHPAVFVRKLAWLLQANTGRIIIIDCRSGRAYLGEPYIAGR